AYFLYVEPAVEGANEADGPLSSLSLEVDLLAGLRLVPLLVVVLVEAQALIGGGADPGARFHLGLELAGRPAGITQHEPQAARPLAGGDGEQDGGVGRHGHAVLDHGGVGARVVAGVQREDAKAFDRPA